MTTFARFNAVGVAGFAVQLGVLVFLHRAGLPLWMATIITVEAAVLHNFAWHERWTWRHVKAGTRSSRLARFHLSNGLISLAGNAMIVHALANAGVTIATASLMAALTCALLNFAAAHLWVFCAKTWPTLHGHLQ